MLVSPRFYARCRPGVSMKTGKNMVVKKRKPQTKIGGDEIKKIAEVTFYIQLPSETCMKNMEYNAIPIHTNITIFSQQPDSSALEEVCLIRSNKAQN